jgi:hypothetical protein
MELGDRLSAASAVLASDWRVILGHGDCHPANILWDGGRAWLVDWERGGPTHPYADLATLSNFLLLSEEIAFGLLAAQEGVPELDERMRELFRAACERSRIVYGAAFLQLVPDLTAVPIGDRAATPPLADCYRQMAAGALPYRDGAGPRVHWRGLVEGLATFQKHGEWPPSSFR